MSEFEDKVNAVFEKMEQNDAGKWSLPDDVAEELDEPTKYAVNAEIRRRDTQSQYTRTNQELKKAQAVSEALEARLLDAEVPLTKEEIYELNQLKKSDPDKWRARLNELETKNKQGLAKELENIRKKSADKGELEVRKEQMTAWSESTGIELNDDVVENDLPPRFLKELEAGKITFEQFLDKAGNFLTTQKTIKGAGESTEEEETDLGQVAGGREPTKQAQTEDSKQEYEKTVF